MDKFRIIMRGYDPEEVNKFLDGVIVQVEKLIADSKAKDEHIKQLNEKIIRFQNLESTLSKTITIASETSEQMRKMAAQESEIIINDAKKNANRIVNDALIRSEKIEFQAQLLRKNIVVFKQKLRTTLNAQLEMVDEIDNNEL